MKVLVTWATGFIASHLVPALAAAGETVIAVGHDPARLPAGDGIESVEVDLGRPLAPGALPAADAVIHLAQANVLFPDGAAALFAVNVASTAALLEHARACRSRCFVHASSASVYGLGDAPFAEGDPARAEDFYSATKLAAERLVTAYSPFFGTTIMRLVAPYGPRQSGRLIPSLIGRVRDARPVTLNDGGRPRMNPIYVDDVVRVITGALASEANHVLNVAGDEVVGIDELARLIGEAVGTEPLFETSERHTHGDLVARNERMKTTFALDQLVPLREGLRRTVLAEVAA